MDTSLNKYIAASGFCSRREADAYIRQGRVTINRRAAQAGNRVQPGDVVEIDGEPFGKSKRAKQRGPVYIAFHKPKGITSTTDERDPTSITRYIGHPERIFPIGRLDKDSEGLILLTSDGDIVNKILRAGNRHEKEYLVTTEQEISPAFLEQMRSGVRIPPDGATLPCKAVQEGKHSFRITLVQGLNRQIRRMCAALDYRVTRLVRVRMMSIRLSGIAAGKWRDLTKDELAEIMQAIAPSSGTEEASWPRVTRRSEKNEPAKPGVPAQAGRQETGKARAGKPGSFKSYREGKKQKPDR